MLARFSGLPEPLAQALVAYSAAVLSVSLVTLAIGIATTFIHVEGLSLVYLLAVLWLACVFGRGSAIVGAFLAFLAFDFFFVPPFHRFTVDDPVEWISLLVLLVTALVIGQLTATVQAHAQKALLSQQRITRLYSLAEMIASTADEDHLLQIVSQQIVQTFVTNGLEAAALFVPDEARQLVQRAVAPAESPVRDILSLASPEQSAAATRVLQLGAPMSLSSPIKLAGAEEPDTLAYFPLWSGHRVVGVVGMVGTAEIKRLMKVLPPLSATSSPVAADEAMLDPQAELFAAFCRQMALALDRAALRKQAIHTEALQESDRLKNVLLGSVTHDLRTPLASIKAATSSLLEPGMSWRAEDCREFIEAIDASTNRLSHLVGNLLDLSRLEAGVATPVKDWHLISEVIATALSQLDRSGQTQGHRIHIEAPETLPLVPLDYAQIERVLINLLENALKYSPPESTIRIVARTRDEPAELYVSVSDQGIGIPADELGAIFGKFYRGRQINLPWANGRLIAGTGLGLAICDQIIQSHGGRIWAESQPGEGSTFGLTLPIPLTHPDGKLPEIVLPELTPAPTETADLP
ncbi:MAG TPA: ATP-binding protein [Ktedonobacterales bacterium]|jgi:two-component system sensor histidine kinase KdpD